MTAYLGLREIVEVIIVFPSTMAPAASVGPSVPSVPALNNGTWQSRHRNHSRRSELLITTSLQTVG
jgi:hypothetical protein